MRWLLFLLWISLMQSQAVGQSRDSRGSRDGESGGRSDRFGRGDRGAEGGGSEGSRGSRWSGGGYRSGGGPVGGELGGGSGFGGGLSDMIRRFDRNRNNMIDPDEVSGPASFFLQRMAQNNPRIDMSKPIPIDLILGEVERFRGGMAGGMGPSAGDEESFSSENTGPELLVPDFRLATSPEPVAGFGVPDSVSQLKVLDRDKAEAEERLRRYDRNRDGFLTPDELAQGRWSGDPMQFDKNRDGKLSVEELSVRQAARREQEAKSGNSGGAPAPQRPGEWGSEMAGGWSRGQDPNARGGIGRDGQGDSGKNEEVQRFGDSKSYRISASAQDLQNLPPFFMSSDANGDGQVTLKEFAAVVTDQKLEEFNRWDLNGDGLITRREAQAAVKSNGQDAVAAPATGRSARVPNPASAQQPTASQPAPVPNSEPGRREYTEADLQWAQRQIDKYDLDKNKVLSKSEWEKMVIKPHKADTNRDGKITPEEMAAYGAKR